MLGLSAGGEDGRVLQRILCRPSPGAHGPADSQALVSGDRSFRTQCAAQPLGPGPWSDQ